MWLEECSDVESVRVWCLVFFSERCYVLYALRNRPKRHRAKSHPAAQTQQRSQYGRTSLARAQAQLLALAYAALSQGREASSEGGRAEPDGYPSGILAELLVPTVTIGLADTRSPVWSHWAGFGVACLVHCVNTRSADTATAMVVALLTTLSELLLHQHATLPPQQVRSHPHYACIHTCIRTCMHTPLHRDVRGAAHHSL